MRLDLHVHGPVSADSRLSWSAIIDGLGVEGLHGFALTDHNSIEGHAALRRLSERYPQYRMIPGVEVSTREGHLLVFGNSELPPIHRPLSETLDWVSARGLPAVLAHPFRRAHGVGARWAGSAPVSGLETLNGHNLELANARAAHLAAVRGVGATGGSDAHLPADLGRAYTEFPDEVSTVEEVLEAIARGRTAAQGRSATRWEGAFASLRSAGLRVGRGFRSI